MKKIRLFAAVIAVTALALTGCSSKPKETEAPKETQAKETQAPETQAKETEAAAVETEAAAVETETAAVETEAAVVETEAAAVETEAAAEETEESAETEKAVETEEVIETEETIETEEAVETEEAIETEEPAETEEESETEEAVETEEETETKAGKAEVLSYAEYEKAEIDELVTIEAYVQDKQIWYENYEKIGTDAVTVYAQDRDGGYFLYKVPCSKSDYAKLKVGTKIRITGYKKEWSGMFEIVADDDLDPIEILREDGIYVAKALDVTDVLDDEEESASYMNQRVAFTGMTVEPADGQEEIEAAGSETEAETEAEDAPAFLYDADGSGSEGDDLFFRASFKGKTYLFVVESDQCDKNTEVYQAVKSLKVGDVIDMEGFMYWHDGPNPHITSVVVEGAEEEE